jgi:hypothetical protein
MRAIDIAGLVIWTMVLHAAPAPMQVTVRTDRTALYPGDRLEYIVRVEHPADVEFVGEHLKKDQLTLDPFELLSVASVSGDLPHSRKFFEVKLVLTTFDVSHTEATIPSFNLFYFRRTPATSKEDSPAETLAVPPLKIGLRSTLVDPEGSLRDSRNALAVRKAEWMLPAILGWCGLVAISVYLAWLGVAWARSGFWRQRTVERSRKRSMEDSLEEIRQAQMDSPEDVENFYRRASDILRSLAAEKLGDGAGLTPRETETALLAAGAEDAQAKVIGELMKQCELFRYAPDGLGKGQAMRPEFLRKFEELTERR